MDIGVLEQIKQGSFEVNESSDLTQTFKELNSDTIDKDGFSSIDTRTKLTYTQVPALTALDIMCQVGIIPQKYNRIGRSIKRLSVSINGGGRKDMVSVSRGSQEQKQQMGTVAQRVGGNNE